MEHQPTTPTFDDEIDLFELFESIWQGKWLVAASVVVSALFGGLFLALYPSEYTGSLVIKPQSAAYISAFEPLNRIPNISQANIVGGKVIGYEGVITSETLLHDFIFDFQTYDVIREVLAQHSSEYQSLSVSADEKSDFLNHLARQFQLNEPDKKMRYHELSFTTNDKAEAKLILSIAFQQINENIRRATLARVNNLSSSIENTLNNEIKHIENELFLIKERYKLQTTSHIAFLKEQAAIARELGVEDSSLDAFSDLSTKSIGISLGGELPFYLRGYKAIEKEIALIESRPDSQLGAYIEGLPELQIELQRLQRDRRVKEINQALALIPLTNPPLQAVVADLSLIEYQNHKKHGLVLVLAILLGGMLGVFIVLIRKGYGSYQQKRQADWAKIAN